MEIALHDAVDGKELFHQLAIQLDMFRLPRPVLGTSREGEGAVRQRSRCFTPRGDGNWWACVNSQLRQCGFRFCETTAQSRPPKKSGGTKTEKLPQPWNTRLIPKYQHSTIHNSFGAHRSPLQNPPSCQFISPPLDPKKYPQLSFFTAQHVPGKPPGPGSNSATRTSPPRGWRCPGRGRPVPPSRDAAHGRGGPQETGTLDARSTPPGPWMRTLDECQGPRMNALDPVDI